MEMFVFTGLVVRDGDSYSALCPELDVATQGASAQEARALLLEAATLHLEGAFEDGLPYLRPIPREEDPRLMAPEHVEEEFRFKVDVVVRAYAWAPRDQAQRGDRCAGTRWIPSGSPTW